MWNGGVNINIPKMSANYFVFLLLCYNTTRSSADADNALDANEAVPNK